MTLPARAPAGAAAAVRVAGDEPVRVAVAAATVCGVATMGAAGLLPPLVAVLLAAVVLGAAWAGWRLSAPEHQGVRVLAGLGLVTAGALAAVALWSAGQLLLVAGVCLALLAAAQGVRQESVRDLLFSLAPPPAMLLVSVTLGSGAALALPLVMTQLLVLAAASLAVPLRVASSSSVVQLPAPGASTGLRSLPRAVTGAALALVLGAAVFLVLPSSMSTDAAGPSVGALADAAQAGGLGRGDAAPGRTTEAYSSGALDMSSRGDLPETPVLDVPAASPTLWRGTVLDTYDGRRWTASYDGTPAARGSVEVPWPGPPEAEGAVLRRYDVRPVDGRVQAIHAPGTPVLVEGAGEFAVVPGQVVWTSDDGAASPYVVTVVEPSDDPAVLRSAPASREDLERWTALPATVPQRVLDLSAQLTAAAATPYDAMRAVEEHLRSSYLYDLDPRVPENGEDAVDAFLFADREGYCEQFAAAGVVLLRAAGIPARLATGFTAGDVDGDRRVFRARNAHAWVEVHLDGIGWVSSDPTAGARRAEPTAADRLLDALLDALRSQPGRLLLALGLVAGAALVAAVVWVLGRRRGRAAAEPGAPAADRSALLAAYARLELALAEDGRARAPAESLRELAQRLPPGAWPALTVVERAAFGRGPVTSAEAHRAVDELDAVTTSVLAERLQPAAG